MNLPERLSTILELQRRVEDWRQDGERVGLVPTMGALHEGHLSLVAEAAARASRVIVSIFVNPAQFSPLEDFDRYPRRIEEDRALLAAGGRTDIMFSPSVDELYPAGFATQIKIGGPALGLESDFRPQFFSGVATVVTKLLVAATPDIAMFGEKDYQQLLVVRQLVRDLGLPVEIAGVAIVREADGLAMSSRNAYLDLRERMVAGKLNLVLKNVAEHVQGGEAIAAAQAFGATSLREAGFAQVDYVAVRDASTLAPLPTLSSPARVLAAARIGSARLIDNIAV